MSSVRGRVSVDVQFADSTSSDSVQSLKTITLQNATEHTNESALYPLKVVMLTGTAGTTDILVANLGSTTPYKNAAGANVIFSGGYVDGLAFSFSGDATLRGLDDIDSVLFRVTSRAGRIAVDQGRHFLPVLRIAAAGTSSTGTYRIVVWGQ